MIFKNEEKILKIIKYAPSAFVLILSSFLVILLFIDNKITFNKEKNELELEYITTNKEFIQNDVELVYKYIQKQQLLTEERLKENLQDRVNEAYSIALEIYNQNKHLSKDVIKKMIKDALVNIRFNDGRGYFFIYSMDYECILLPINRKLEGTSFYNFKEGKGTYLTRNIIAMMKEKKEGFLTWWFPKPNDLNNSYKKIGFNKYFEPLDWFIGTGEYFDEFEASIQKKVLTDIEEMTLGSDNKYLFILKEDGMVLSHPKKEFIGKNILNISEIVGDNGKKEAISNIETFKQIALKNGGFYQYQHINNKKEWLTKTSYIKGLDSWKWILGKGFYENDVQQFLEIKKEALEKEFNKQLYNIFFFTFCLIIFLLALSSYVSRMLGQKFKEYNRNIQEHIQKDKLQQELLAQQSKMAAMGEMIGNIAHQWRQPLSAITLSATTLGIKREIEDLSQEEFSVHVENITNSANYLSSTIEDFRNFFQPQKEKNSFQIENTIEKTLKLVYAQLKNKQITIIKNIEPIKLYSYENELIQVLINIVNNAKDELEKIEGEKFIFIDVFSQGNDVCIKIQDTGHGLAYEIINRIFEPYFTTKHQKQGTGIGLYMSNQIISKHLKGSLVAANSQYEYNQKLYKGALFTLVIPQSLQ